MLLNDNAKLWYNLLILFFHVVLTWCPTREDDDWSVSNGAQFQIQWRVWNDRLRISGSLPYMSLLVGKARSVLYLRRGKLNPSTAHRGTVFDATTTLSKPNCCIKRVVCNDDTLRYRVLVVSTAQRGNIYLKEIPYFLTSYMRCAFRAPASKNANIQVQK
jgi:hypothetical protein